MIYTTNLQTKVAIPPPDFNINHSSVISLFGSCFSDNIGRTLEYNKFNVTVNPFGVLYNPASIAQSINLLFTKQKFLEKDILKLNELWYSFYHHTSFSSTDKELCLQKINNSFIAASSSIKNSDIVIFTLGTAWAYRYNLTGQIISNCHKIPAGEFTRQYLEPLQIVELLKQALLKIVENSPNTQFIFTVSPIRHWKDGAIENTRSKAALILAIMELQKLFSQVYYFPVYEIYMDELRDYRFYAGDMLHPSDFSIEYIWERFKETFFSKETIRLCKEIEKLLKSFEHRIFNANTVAYRKFKTKLLNSAETLMQKHPSINFTNEIKDLRIH